MTGPARARAPDGLNSINFGIKSTHVRVSIRVFISMKCLMLRISCGILAGCLIFATMAVSGSRAAVSEEAVPSGGLPARFAREIWPLMMEPDEAAKGCLACHRDDDNNTSPLIFPGDPKSDFETLLAGGYFDRGKPNSILSRVSSVKPGPWMPPEPLTRWSDKEVDRLRKFVAAVEAEQDQKRPESVPRGTNRKPRAVPSRLNGGSPWPG